MKPKPIKLLLLVAIVPSMIFAGIMRTGIQLELALPLSEFMENVSRAGYGAGLAVTANLNKYLAIGIGAGVVSFGSETRIEISPPRLLMSA
jgi:hypothetical protein